MEPSAPDEAPRDPGALITHPSYTDQDFEGHRAHTVYVGLHVPGYRRRSHHRRHHRHHKNGQKKREDGTTADYNNEFHKPVTPPAERVHFILGEDEDGTHEAHPLFSEMEELHGDGDDMEWRETARWIKFEEDVEEGGNRWSKPHVATISLHSLFELRSCILNGTVMLDMEAQNLEQISDLVLENMVNSGQLQADFRDRVKEALLRRHRHQHERRHEWSEKSSRLPLIRSLAEIGRNSSKSMFGSHNFLDIIGGGASPPTTPNAPSAQGEWKPHFSKYLALPGSPANNNHDVIPKSPSSNSLQMHVPHPQLAQAGSTLADSSAGNTSSADLQHRLNQGFMRKIPPGSEASNILVGEVNFLDRAIIAFVRLSQACHLGDLTEVPVPTRFLFMLLGPQGNLTRYHEIGRAIATLMSDEVFHDVAYKAKSRQDLLAGVDEFLDAVTVLPPGAWDPSIRIEPPNQLPSQDGRKKNEPEHKIDTEEEEEKEREESGLKRTGRLFGGLINDVKRKLPWYLSDFKDALALQSVASVFFLYFACLTPIITFGGLLGEATKKRIAAMESLLSGAICGIIYGLFSGQPLTILGSTGPVLVFETILFDICKEYNLQYLSLRLWIGIWTSIILFLLVAFDASALVCYITRFTEENFATLISLIFIYKAIEKVLHIGDKYPMESSLPLILNNNTNCFCELSNNTTTLSIGNYNLVSAFKKECINLNGTLVGDACKVPESVPNVFLFSIILFASTFVVSICLKDFRFTPFFPSKIRLVISDFSVVIAILLMTVIDLCVGINTPKLEVPQEFKPTWPKRDWLIPWFGTNPWWTALVAVLPALLCTILIFMDQQITAVIINRKENKLKKGCGYHLDLFVLAVLIAICSILGLPWFVAATVLAMTHVNSLRMESECSAPGEKPQFLGVREQRVTQLCIFTLVGLSVFFTPVLKLIPMPVLFGVFLYMGFSSLKGSQLYDRILILFMPQKYQPDLTFLRHVPTTRVHLFTLVQLVCLILLWVIKSYKPTSIAFPLMLVVMIGVRKLLDFVFTQRELKLLDDVMPEHTKKKREEDMRKHEEEKKGAFTEPLANALEFSCTFGSPNETSYWNQYQGMLLPNASSGNVAIPLANGNILKVPVEKFKGENESGDQSAINISEQLAQTGLWQSIDQQVQKTPQLQPKSVFVNAVSRKKKRGRAKKDAKNEEERRRLSTMAEEDDEDDCGITIKIDAPTPCPSNGPSLHNSPTDKHNETSV
ncbi:sodium-driven chloride bicarbonate exchanger-like [Centruroides sculpturatus]|uniref:sodium-driven chloride bicarbonate exchanger-like n=1 Tax=Centruroides sculpturatus TaxID=218467 RepID=UPI000C6C996A|nr:sodium-driven chloride bicarbonate exchanger-like [Centruroides sculpturatus]